MLNVSILCTFSCKILNVRTEYEIDPLEKIALHEVKPHSPGTSVGQYSAELLLWGGGGRSDRNMSISGVWNGLMSLSVHKRI